MAMGKSPRRARQASMWVADADLPRTAGHPFYERLNRVLAEAGFDAFVEAQCAKFYADGIGRPSLPPGLYFRMLLLGYLAGRTRRPGRRRRTSAPAGQARCAEGVVWKPPSHSWQPRSSFSTPPRGAGRAAFRAPVRDRGSAPGFGARPGECPQAGTHPGGRLQPRTAPAPPDWRRHAPEPAGAGSFGDLRTDRVVRQQRTHGYREPAHGRVEPHIPLVAGETPSPYSTEWCRRASQIRRGTRVRTTRGETDGRRMESDAGHTCRPDGGRTRFALTRDSSTIKTLRVKHTKVLRGARGCINDGASSIRPAAGAGALPPRVRRW